MQTLFKKRTDFKNCWTLYNKPPLFFLANLDFWGSNLDVTQSWMTSALRKLQWDHHKEVVYVSIERHTANNFPFQSLERHYVKECFRQNCIKFKFSLIYIPAVPILLFLLLHLGKSGNILSRWRLEKTNCCISLNTVPSWMMSPPWILSRFLKKA